MKSGGGRREDDGVERAGEEGVGRMMVGNKKNYLKQEE